MGELWVGQLLLCGRDDRVPFRSLFADANHIAAVAKSEIERSYPYRVSSTSLARFTDGARP